MYDDYDTYDDDFGFDFPGDLNPVKAVKTLGEGVVSGVKATGKLIGNGAKAAGKLATNITDELGKVPVVGPALGGTFQLTIGGPFRVAGDIASGKRLDKVALNHLKREIGSVKAVGPYVQTVISFVPGVGQGISAGIGAGLALADGQPIDKAMIAAARGAVPGGPVAAAAFDVGVAALEGKAVDEVAIQALPLPKDFKKGVSATLRIAKDLANGKRVDDALLREAYKHLPPEGQRAYNIAKRTAKGDKLASILVDETMKELPESAQKAMTVGMAMGQGKRLQELADKELKSRGFKNNLVKFGRGRAAHNSVFRAGAKLAGTTTIALATRRRRRGSASITRRRKKRPKMSKSQALAKVRAIIAKKKRGVKLSATERLVLKIYKKKFGKRKTRMSKTQLAMLKARAARFRKSGKWRKRKKLPPKRAAKRSRRGFYLGLGLMGHSKVTRRAIHNLRSQLKGAEKRGFDMALSTQVGMVKKKKAPPALTSKEKAGYYMTRGMAGARAAQKVGMMKAIASDFETRSGASLAVQQFLDERRPWYKKVWGWFTG